MTLATTVQAIRELLDDRPDEDYLAAAVATDSTTTMTVTDVSKHAKGKVWEFHDATGDIVLERSVVPDTAVVTIKRGHLGSTAAAHSNAVVILDDPKFRYNQIVQAINTVLDADLYSEGLYEIVEHQITSSATTDIYNAPSTACKKFLHVYQKTAGMDEPRSAIIRFSTNPTNADVSLYSNGKWFQIEGNYGIPGTDLFYVNCAHALTITTTSAAEDRIIQYLAAAYLLEATEIRRVQGPTTQGDRTVRPGQGIGTAAYFRGLAEELMAKRKYELGNQLPHPRNFVRV